MKLQDYKQEWNELSEKKNLSGKEALEAVKEDDCALQYVNKQTSEICLEAVKQNGNALRYVKEQTSEMCLEAVKEDDVALQYVSEDMFEEEEEYIIDGKKFSKATLKEALRSYIN